MDASPELRTPSNVSAKLSERTGRPPRDEIAAFFRESQRESAIRGCLGCLGQVLVSAVGMIDPLSHPTTHATLQSGS